MVCLRVGFFSLVGFALAAMAEPGFIPLPQLPSEFHQSETYLPDATTIATETIEFAPPQFETSSMGTVRVHLPNAQTLRVETLPEIPYYERTFNVGEEAEVDVVLKGYVALGTDGPVPLNSLAETEFWADGQPFELAKPAKGRFFPGKILQVVQKGDLAVVRIFPLQWDQKNHQLLRVSKLEFDLFKRSVERLARPAANTSQSIILVRAAQKAMADDLQSFHLKHYGMVSDIVTVEEVEKNASEISEAALPEGYKDRALSSDSVIEWDPATQTGYNYTLARKLASFFQARLSGSSKLKYITLLGDGVAIPPSYYFSGRAGLGARFSVTDQCYSSINQCLKPKAALGRLPFTKPDELKNYFSKVQRWLNYVPTSPSELALYGGKPFSGPFYVGELGALRTLSGVPNWSGVKKFFRTKQNYNRDSVLQALNGELSSSVLFSLDHGRGNIWRVEKRSITSDEILEAKSAGPKVNPLIFSIACINAAFDETTAKDEIFTSPDKGDVSVGVALLRSRAGAVGYFGSARQAVGGTHYEVDSRGNMNSLGSNHSLKIMESAVQEYHARGEGKIGDFLLKALLDYSTDPASPLSDERFRWTYLNAAFLGDPVMKMPARPGKESVSVLASALNEIEKVFSGYFPSFDFADLLSATLKFESKVPVEATLFAQESLGSMVVETVLESNTFPAGTSEMEFSPSEDPMNYFMRIENKTGVPVERQVWFRTRY